MALKRLLLAVCAWRECWQMRSNGVQVTLRLPGSKTRLLFQPNGVKHSHLCLRVANAPIFLQMARFSFHKVTLFQTNTAAALKSLNPKHHFSPYFNYKYQSLRKISDTVHRLLYWSPHSANKGITAEKQRFFPAASSSSHSTLLSNKIFR